MSRKIKKVTKRREDFSGSEDERQRQNKIGRTLIRITVIVGLSVGAVFGMRAMEKHVITIVTEPQTADFEVQLSHRPMWMPPMLADQIVTSVRNVSADFYDPKLTELIYKRAVRNPWIRSVEIVRKYISDDTSCGVVEIEADFRKPLARVGAEGIDAYVDSDGVRLPGWQVPQWVLTVPAGDDSPARQVCYMDGDQPRGAAPARIHYIMIEGVSGPPPEMGQTWEGEDVRDALRLIELVSTRKYANQITVVDVRNHTGRVFQHEPHIRMWAQVERGRATDIRFGRFPAPGGGDYVVSPQRKMSYLDNYVADHDGLVAGLNSYIDLRHDELHVSIN